jgi:lysophospholipase L1-like esterase
MRATAQHLALMGVLAVGLGVGAGAREPAVIDKLRDFRNALYERSTPPEKKPRVSQFELFARPAEVVMLGDSLVESGLWNEMFQGVSIANRGVRGDTTEDLLLRLDTVENVHPRKVFIMAGINDLYRGRSNEQIFETYRGIVRELTKRGVSVYVQSTVECNKASCGYKLQRIRELNAGLKRLMEEEGIPFVDLNAGLATAEQGLKPEFTYDGTHLEGAGYAAWAEKLGPYMLD